MKIKKEKNNLKLHSQIRQLTMAAMLTAMSVVIGIMCKNHLNFAKGLFRITFENLPIIMAGILFGPVVGGLVGIATDIISYFFSSQVYPPNLIVTFGAMSVGVVSGLISKYIYPKKGTKQIILSGVFAHVVGSMIIKSIGLYQFYQMAVLVRIPLYLIIATLEILLLCVLFSRRSFRRLTEYY